MAAYFRHVLAECEVVEAVELVSAQLRVSSFPPSQSHHHQQVTSRSHPAAWLTLKISAPLTAAEVISPSCKIEKETVTYLRVHCDVVCEVYTCCKSLDDLLYTVENDAKVKNFQAAMLTENLECAAFA